MAEKKNTKKTTSPAGNHAIGELASTVATIGARAGELELNVAALRDSLGRFVTRLDELERQLEEHAAAIAAPAADTGSVDLGANAYDGGRLRQLMCDIARDEIAEARRNNPLAR